jgi:hypothetical protein
MLNEIKILFNNIKTFRHLISESVGAESIVPYIQNHEWIYIYYAGDDNNKMGYRTVRPYVLGTSTAGNEVLRAWQDNPKNSQTFDNRPTRTQSMYHDYWIDNEGEKPGWRLFRLDKISKVYPIGRKFDDENGNVMIPAGYHEGGDANMTSIKAFVSTKKQPDLDYKYDKEFTGDIQTKKQTIAQKWDSIRKGNSNSKKITASDVTKLGDIVSRILKKKKSDYLVAIDDRGNFRLITGNEKQKNNIPDTAIVGGLSHLYDTLVNQNKSADDTFYNSIKAQTQKSLEQQKQNDMDKGFSTIQEINKNITTIPFNKKPFFK